MTHPDCPDLSMWADTITATGTDLTVIGDELLQVVKEGIESHPRSAQKEIGPSELGHPCNRWLAHKLAGTPATGIQKPPWRQAVGTAVHADFSAWCHHWNEDHGVRFLTDIRVHVGDLYPGRPITGHLDAIDLATATIVDLKVPGKSAMQRYGDGKPESPQYDVQLDSYGQGAVRAGFPVQSVGILRLPAAGELHEAVWKARPHNPQRAADALARAGAVAQMVDAIGPAAIPLQTTSEHYCARCSYFLPNTTDLTRACPGADTFIASRDARRDPVHDLVDVS